MSEPQPIICYNTASLHVQTTDQQNTLPPPWLAGALLIAQLWRADFRMHTMQLVIPMHLKVKKLFVNLVEHFPLKLLVHDLTRLSGTL
jgi:hypothetical protein